VLHDRIVPAEAAGTRLDVWLETQLDGCSRSLVSRLIKQGLCAVVAGRGAAVRIKAGYAIRGGDRIALEVPEIESSDLEAEELPLTILHEDAQIIVVDKAAGMVVHPAVGHRRGTLVNALLGRYGLAPGGDPWRPGIVHRLDEHTSGVIVVARTPQALAFLQAAFRERRVHKRYLAVIHGSPRADYLEHVGWLVL
jgi:23S rRNA pseudouridine1911/1915/1917 synthase